MAVTDRPPRMTVSDPAQLDAASKTNWTDLNKANEEEYFPLSGKN